jgi:DNA replication protein DnaC
MPSDEPQTIPIPIDLPQPGENDTTTDWEAKSARYVAEARRASALKRWDVLAAELPEMVETDWTRTHFDTNRAAIESVIRWQRNAKGLLLSGPTGRGKTRAIMALLRKLALDDGQDFRYWHASEWFSELQKQNRYGRDEASSWVGATAVRPIVVIDDLGQEAMSTVKGEDWAQAWFFRFLDVRLAHGLPLIVTTNLSASAIAGTAQRAEIRSDPLIRRLMDLCEVVRFV